MFAKFLGIEMYVELGWGKPLFHQPIFILHNQSTVEIRVLNSIIILNKTMGDRNDTTRQTDETGESFDHD
mgnify:CR=1 FL=1